jgi:hypothetical protein
VRFAILLAALGLVACAVTALAAGALAAPAVYAPAHFGRCPAGQHWEQSAGLLPGWNCVR